MTIHFESFFCIYNFLLVPMERYMFNILVRVLIHIMVQNYTRLNVHHHYTKYSCFFVRV